MDRSITMKETVYKQIVEMICTGKLAADEIFTETQMMERFGVSRAPIREALIQLCHEEVLESIPRCGYRVVGISIRNIRDITELRLYLELSSLPRIIEKTNNENLLEIRRKNEEQISKDETKNAWNCWNRNVDFHLTLNSYARNSQVTTVLKKALATCTRAYAQLYTLQSEVMSPPKAEGTRHDFIVEALENHDLQHMKIFLEQDILFMEQQLLLNRTEIK